MALFIVWTHDQIGVLLNPIKITAGGGQMETQRTYIAIDLKSFYASVECSETWTP